MFWERFCSLCEREKIKPNPFGLKFGVSSGTITNWKQGSLPSAELLIKFAEYFNVSIDYLLGLTNEPFPLAKKDLATSDDAVRVLARERNLSERSVDWLNNTLDILEKTDEVKSVNEFKDLENKVIPELT